MELLADKYKIGLESEVQVVSRSSCPWQPSCAVQSPEHPVDDCWGAGVAGLEHLGHKNPLQEVPHPVSPFPEVREKNVLVKSLFRNKCLNPKTMPKTDLVEVEKELEMMLVEMVLVENLLLRGDFVDEDAGDEQ